MDRSELIAQIPGLRRYARVLTGNAWAADDLVQDTLERACSKWRLWAAGSNLRAWLFTLMHNQFANQVRRSIRQSNAGRMVDMEDVNDELIAADTGLDMAMDLHRCLMRLPEDQRATLLLVSLEDMSYEDVARITGVPVGTVMSRLSRARARLRELMEGSLDKTPALRAVTHKPVLHRLQ
ncbi:sigma-70 family RNA polymerase sigma factor [Polaromonas sp.]|uniref:sigma-70 family RNA polymerase sigma factor n=1 Tax=Polaromonas sp. TaxID=1869339 RepID=UPI00286C8F87|nr:sigma-70 family RNA polymerase sigma factor [Polaromonas sp.]